MPRQIDKYLQSVVDEDRFAFYQAVCDFSDAEIAPHILNWEREHILVPDSAIQKMAQLGLFGLTVSEKYGGFGLPALLNGIYLEMLARADPSLMMVVGLQAGAAADIEKYGDDATRQKWLPRFASGEKSRVELSYHFLSYGNRMHRFIEIVLHDLMVVPRARVAFGRHGLRYLRHGSPPAPTHKRARGL